jgi:predicted nucleic acid-binding protein
MRKFVIDTNVYIAAARNAEANAALASFQKRFVGFVWQHTVVAQELLAGARDEAGYRGFHEDWVAPFEDSDRVITPSHEAWLQAALILVRLVERRKRSPGGFSRSLLNDCLIAASALEHGFTLITDDTADFRLIAEVEPDLRFIRPWPGT